MSGRENEKAEQKLSNRGEVALRMCGLVWLCGMAMSPTAGRQYQGIEQAQKETYISVREKQEKVVGPNSSAMQKYGHVGTFVWLQRL